MGGSPCSTLTCAEACRSAFYSSNKFPSESSCRREHVRITRGSLGTWETWCRTENVPSSVLGYTGRVLATNYLRASVLWGSLARFSTRALRILPTTALAAHETPKLARGSWVPSRLAHHAEEGAGIP